jgi:hypothetical protein
VPFTYHATPQEDGLFSFNHLEKFWIPLKALDSEDESKKKERMMPVLI